MRTTGIQRWGMLLDILAQMSNAEQPALEADHPGSFHPGELLGQWYETFRDGRGLAAAGLSSELLSALWEFDDRLGNLIDDLPVNPDDTDERILDEQVWQTIQELANWTLNQITDLMIPVLPSFSKN